MMPVSLTSGALRKESKGYSCRRTASRKREDSDIGLARNLERLRSWNPACRSLKIENQSMGGAGVWGTKLPLSRYVTIVTALRSPASTFHPDHNETTPQQLYRDTLANCRPNPIIYILNLHPRTVSIVLRALDCILVELLALVPCQPYSLAIIPQGATIVWHRFNIKPINTHFTSQK